MFRKQQVAPQEFRAQCPKDRDCSCSSLRPPRRETSLLNLPDLFRSGFFFDFKQKIFNLQCVKSYVFIFFEPSYAKLYSEFTFRSVSFT